MAQEFLQQYLDQFTAFEQQLNGESKQPIHALRKSALETFSSVGFPTIKQEEWRYTPLTSLLKTTFAAAQKEQVAVVKDVEAWRASYPVAAELVFVNGCFAKDLSKTAALPEGVVVSDMATAMNDHAELLAKHLGTYADTAANGFSALNTSFLQDGVFVYVPGNVVVEEPVHALFLSASGDTPVVSHPRVLVVVEHGGAFKLVESYASADEHAHFTNAVVEVFIGDNAQVEHYRVQWENKNAYHVTNAQAKLGRNANYKSHSFMFGGKLIRNNAFMGLHGEGAEGTLNGLFMPRGNQHMDNNTVIDHAVPHCKSFEVFKGLLDDESHGVFSGKIIVRPDAQKTDAKQSNNNILLSDKAAIDTKPQLEIFADDVRCTHGATIGRLDEKALFYLRSRGLDKEQAFDLLSYAFASDLVNVVNIGGLRAQLDAYLHDRLKEVTY